MFFRKLLAKAPFIGHCVPFKYVSETEILPPRTYACYAVRVNVTDILMTLLITESELHQGTVRYMKYANQLEVDDMKPGTLVYCSNITAKRGATPTNVKSNLLVVTKSDKFIKEYFMFASSELKEILDRSTKKSVILRPTCLQRFAVFINRLAGIKVGEF